MRSRGSAALFDASHLERWAGGFLGYQRPKPRSLDMRGHRELRWAVEAQHRCKAVPLHEVSVHEKQDGHTLWYGTVTVFALEDHPTATRAYAWYYEMLGTRERTFLSALHVGPVNTAAGAVRAALATMK